MIAHKWEHISQLPADNPYDFSEINTFQRQWLEYRQTQEASSPDVFRDFHERVTRSWAIETGIIEGLYTLDAGMTQTLVTHGISADRIERGTTNKDPEDLALVLTDHQEAVNGVYQSIRQGLPISRTAIRQLHQVLTKHQLTYKVVDQFGREFETELHHGAFKTQPNSPTRNDGELHEYCPPEHVDSELDNMLTWYQEYTRDIDRYHPLLTAAWLHHRFAQIHPFEDGNGRVVRALLTWHLVRENYLPVVVKRGDRDDYMDALELADQGDLGPFVDLLVRLQKRNILEALGESHSTVPVGPFDQVLDHIAELVSRRNIERETELRSANIVAEVLRDQAETLLIQRAEQVCARLDQAGTHVTRFVDRGGPEDRAYWYHNEIVETAKKAGNYMNPNEDRFFVKLSLIPNQPMRQTRLVFVVSLHHTGRQLTGVMAATAFALFDNYHSNDVGLDEEEGAHTFVDCTPEPFAFTWESNTNGLISQFSAWTEQCLAMALRHWGERLS